MARNEARVNHRLHLMSEASPWRKAVMDQTQPQNWEMRLQGVIAKVIPR
jgi:hypothetical protein